VASVGGITVRLSKERRQARLIVQDTGSGIPAEELPRLFERFHRVESTKGRTHEGTGIGLALVQELVKIHGGTVSVDSEVGRGSTFTVAIPVGKDHLPAERLGRENALASTAADYSAFVEEAMRWLPETDKGTPGIKTEVSELDLESALLRGFGAKAVSSGDRDRANQSDNGAERQRVIIADDNADMRDYLRRLLEDRYEVVAVSDGHEALQAAREFVPVLILSDVMMPNLDGFGLLQAVRIDPSLAAVPVVLLSARAGEEAILEGIRAGADEYLIKPFSARELIARVDAQIQRKQFERQLAAAEQRLQAALAAAKMAILHEEDRDRTRLAVERAVFHHEPYDIEYRTVAPDGRIRWVRAKGRAYFDATGSPTRFDGVTLDVTALKTNEQRREHMLATGRAAREEAERVIRMKDEFLATLSHELRTPLNAILGWSQILSRDSLESDDAQLGLQAIERNTRAQAQMIEDLLDMSRISAGKVRLDVHRLVLADVVSQAIQSVRPSAEVKGVRLITVIDPNAGPVAGDAGRHQQVVWNLLTNAIKFTPRGGRVQVVLERVNSHLELNVTDTGEGIAPEFLPHVFERFRQADASTTRQHRGLGLGLSIVKQLVELHGGSVRVKSPGRGKGSTFILNLNLAPTTDARGNGETEERQHPRVARGEPVIYQSPNLNGITVLVVDDDPDAREVIARILRGGGASVLTASSVATAMELLRESTPGLLVSDIGMPGEDGYDLIRKVRALTAEDCGPGARRRSDRLRSIGRPATRVVGRISVARGEAG
jgi:signal transduction histidine kinase